MYITILYVYKIYNTKYILVPICVVYKVLKIVIV